HRDPEDQEDPGGGANARAGGQLRELPGDLGLRELDLLADEQRCLLGDLGDDLAEVLVRAAVRAHRVSLLSISARARPPANAAPTKASGRSANASLSLS